MHRKNVQTRYTQRIHNKGTLVSAHYFLKERSTFRGIDDQVLKNEGEQENYELLHASHKVNVFSHHEHYPHTTLHHTTIKDPLFSFFLLLLFLILMQSMFSRQWERKKTRHSLHLLLSIKLLFTKPQFLRLTCSYTYPG